MCKYNFYYDESEHSRKINKNTIMANNYYDNFVSVVVGWNNENETDLFRKYTAFEEKYVHRKSKGELKSTTIRQKQLKHGFASLNHDNVCLLSDYLDLFEYTDHVYYCIVSKIEYIVRQIFENYSNSLTVDMDAMKYSIIKTIVLYQPIDVIQCFYENTDEFVTVLSKFFSTIIEKNKANEQLKKVETEQCKQILNILENVSSIKNIDWNYNISFVGFKKYLNENSIDNYSLIIDKEGDKGNMVTVANQERLINVSEANSTSSCGIRMADMLAGIMSKLLKALHKSLSYATEAERVSKRILNSCWFDISEEQLNLYKKLKYIAVDLNKSWYKAFSGIYSDDLIVFIALLNYMSSFDSVNEMKNDISMHGEYFNSCCCNNLCDYYKRMHSKLPVEPIERISKEYYTNQRGAIVYYDIEKQPFLEIPKGSITYNVLSVGFNQNRNPLITIMEADNANCYRVPDALADWAIATVSMANMGVNLFPANVMFSKTKDGVYADIL